jgi:hypothetical protein
MSFAVGSRGEAERPAEARGERADASQPDRKADLVDRTVGVAEECGRSLEPPGQQVLMRRLAEGAPKLTAEVRGREPRSLREGRDVQRLAVARVDQILRPQ